MSASSEIERIIIELEEQGGDKAYVGVKRLDDIMKDISKHKGPTGIAESFEALTTLNDKLSNSLLEIPGLADKAAGAWGKLVGQIRAYNESQVNKAMRNTDLEIARKDAQDLHAKMQAANRIPTHLQSASSPKSIDYAAALATQSQKAGSAIEAASHSAMEEAIAIGEAAQAASKLSSVYDVIEKRAKAAAKIDKDHLADQMRMANRIPTHLQSASGPKTLTGGQKAFQAFSRTFGPKATQGLVSTVETMEKIGPIASKIGPPLATAAVAMGAVAIAAGGAAIWAAKSFGESVIEAQAYKEDVAEAFKTVERARMSQESKGLGLNKSGTQLTLDAEASSKVLLKQSNQLADRFGTSRESLSGQFLDLTTKGFKPNEVERIIGSLSDLGTIDSRAGSAAGREGLTKAFGQMKATGRVNLELLNTFNTFGLESGDVIGEIGKKLGKDNKEVLRMLSSAGGIRGLDQEVIIAAIQKQTDAKNPGDAMAAKADRDISKLMERVKNIPKNIFFDVEVESGLDGAKDVLHSILDFFDVKKGKGKEVREVGADLFNAMVEGLTGNKIDTKKGITGTLDAILAGAKEAVPVVRELAGGARDMMGLAAGIAGTIGSISEATGGLGNMGAIWKGLSLSGRLMMAPILGPLALLPELRQGYLGISDLFDGNFKGAKEHFTNMLPGGEFFGQAQEQFNGFFNSIGEDIRLGASNMLNAGMTYGSNLWQGIVQGISGGITAVAESATNLANSALAAVGSTWRVGSPARAFEEYSLFAGDGTVRGFKKSESSVYSAAASMAIAGLGGAWAAGQSNSNGGAGITAISSAGGGSGVVINFSPTIIVSGANSPAQAQVIGAAAVQGARAQFEAQMGTGLRRLRYG